MTEMTKRLILAVAGGVSLGIVATCFAGSCIVSHGHVGSTALAVAIQGVAFSTVMIVLAFKRHRGDSSIAAH